MLISSDFDSGNIEVLDASNPRQVRLAMRPDLNSHHFQWFHFKVAGMSPGQRYGFSLCNAGQSAYSHAWSGYNAVASYDQVNWFRVPSRFEEGALQFELEPREAQVWFAYFEPYSRARHDWLIGQALEKAGAELFACGKSIEGRDIQLLRISRTPQATRKIWIIAQQHPGEHMAEWFMEGLIERLQDPDDAELNALLAQAELYLVPNMNPDGAFRGHLRTNAAGKDLNRAWQSASEAESPEVFFVQQQMRRVGVDLFLDIHGDEEIPHVFTAGCEGNPGYSPRLAALEDEFRRRLVDIGAEFQTAFGYPRDEPGQANLTLACNAVGEEFDCLSFTIEMPFKDHDDNPEPLTAWSGRRSKRLGHDVLSVAAAMVGTLR
ncbi:carboxypeptidase family protein [Pseudomonas sp. LPB0260]|uniref:M14 family metallopeptidase n=1 Tax=Pseudomonas sp. LPB0260 TaxID=2614442 RepID=UPI0015C2365E|nr:M14-type cytosolic carboxypeptidase [Pseudomonas sp. LPB0260]QLC73916.1 carboxypeptidase family protein [Pseudomonas sp. LPB0260]QLC76690.1 carboxypeptidase family protein [Pseudomonas sp. LPB0260]